MKFLLTIDTEADNQWEHGIPLTTKNIEFVPRLQYLCTQFQIRPTYLITSEICENELASSIFKQYSEEGTAEIGAHLHSWTTSPFLETDGFRYNDPYHAFATELPDHLLHEKLAALTSQIESGVGKRPVSFRSGRYGFNEKVAHALIELGYRVDSSVTPFTNWENNKGAPQGQGGPDFMNYSNTPYTISSAKGDLVEIPVTIMPTRWPLSHHHNLARSFFRKVDGSVFLRAIRKLLYPDQPLWLRPNRESRNRLFYKLVHLAEKQKNPYIVMMFHSSELMPGGSPYWRNEHEIEILYGLLEEFFTYLNNHQIESIMMHQVIEN